MRHADLLLVAPVKYGGWMIKNPSLVQLGHTQNGVTETLVSNSTGKTVMFYTRNPNIALVQMADIIEGLSGCVVIDMVMRDSGIVPENEYFGHEDPEEECE